MLDLGKDVTQVEVEPREIHRHGHCWLTGRDEPVQVFAHLVDYVTVHLVRHPKVLERQDEPRWRQEAHHRVVPARQSLVAADLSRFHADDGLIEDLYVILSYCFVYLVGHVALQPEMLIEPRIVNVAYLVVAALHHVARHACAVTCVACFGAAVLEHIDARLHLGMSSFDRVCNHVMNAVDVRTHLLSVYGCAHDEMVVRKPSYQTVAELAGEGAGHTAKKLVAPLKSKLLVYHFEVQDVEMGERHGTFSSGIAEVSLLSHSVKRLHAQQAREAVDVFYGAKYLRLGETIAGLVEILVFVYVHDADVEILPSVCAVEQMAKVLHISHVALLCNDTIA